MNRLALSRCKAAVAARRGYTLIEILVATALSLLILGAVVQLFGTVGNSISQSRSFLESSERLRTAQTRLQADLKGLTVSPLPPVKPEENQGYLEIIESPNVQGPKGLYRTDYSQNNPANFIQPAVPSPVDTNKGNQLDSTIGDTDILMLTTRSTGKPFTGKYLQPDLTDPMFIRSSVISVESDVAEVAYFVRGRDLHRRVLLVAPSLPLYAQPNKANPWIQNSACGFYADNDISVRHYLDGTVDKVTANTLSDLTRRECRFAHPTVAFPYDAREWRDLGLPTSKETSDVNFIAGVWDTTRIATGPTKPTVMDSFFSKRPDLKFTIPPSSYSYPRYDSWTNDRTARLSDSELLNTNANPAVPYQGSAVADDVILTNVIGFDVKVWDPGAPILQEQGTGRPLYPGDPLYILPGHPQYAPNLTYDVVGFGAYVDLGYCYLYDPTGWATKPLPCPPPQPLFNRYGEGLSGLNGGPFAARVYDTGCFSSQYTGTAIDGFDNGLLGPGASIVDNDMEKPATSPYPHPLRGVQIKIRIFEPDSRQIREVTIEQDFLPK